MVIIEIVNWIGTICVIIGTMLIAKPKRKANLFLVNLLYFLSCACLISVFLFYHNYIMVFQYSVLCIFSLFGIKNNQDDA